jgi:Na+/proline symporter
VAQAADYAPEIGQVVHMPLASYMGSFVIWAAAIAVVPHIVMRVYTAKDARGARLSLNVAMIVYSLMILAAVLVIVPVGKMRFPGLQDADQIFLRVIEGQFPPDIRGLAVAAVLAAVMSTTDALLLACSSAVSHDLLGNFIERKLSHKAIGRVTVLVTCIIGLIAMVLAYSPPKLITEFYSAAIGLLSASLFVPTIAGLWWKRANLSGGIASLLTGAAVYLAVQFTPGTPPLSAILFALPASALAMAVFSRFGQPNSREMLQTVGNLHQDSGP